MKALAVWIDSQEAKIFKFTYAGVENLHLKSHGKTHHAEVHGSNHPKAAGDAEKFFHEVSQNLKNETASQWLLMGPGLAHTHLEHHIQKHHPHMKPQILASEAVDHHLTEKQIIAHARKFFIDKGIIKVEQ